MFSQSETTFIKSQRLARIATVAQDNQPDVTPVGFEFDGTYFYVSGRNITRTRKYKNVQAGHHKVALVIDDLKSVAPWFPRGIRIYGNADLVEREGWLGQSIYVRILPTVSWSWNVEETSSNSGKSSSHKTIHKPEL